MNSATAALLLLCVGGALAAPRAQSQGDDSEVASPFPSIIEIITVYVPVPLNDSFQSQKLTTNDNPQISQLTACCGNVFVSLQNGLVMRLNESLAVQDKVQSTSKDPIKLMDSDSKGLLTATANTVTLYTHDTSKGLTQYVNKTLKYPITSARLFPTYVLIGTANEVHILSRTDLSDHGTGSNPDSGNITQYQTSSFGEFGVIVQGGKGKLRVIQRNGSDYGVTHTIQLPKQDQVVSAFTIFHSTDQEGDLIFAVGYNNSGIQILKSPNSLFSILFGDAPKNITLQMVSEIEDKSMKPLHLQAISDSANNDRILVVGTDKGISLFTVDASNKLKQQDGNSALGATSSGQFSHTSRGLYFLDQSSNQVSGKSLSYVRKQLKSSSQ